MLVLLIPALSIMIKLIIKLVNFRSPLLNVSFHVDSPCRTNIIVFFLINCTFGVLVLDVVVVARPTVFVALGSATRVDIVSSSENLSLLGAAVVAGRRLGLVPSEAAAELPSTERRFVARSDHCY